MVMVDKIFLNLTVELLLTNMWHSSELGIVYILVGKSKAIYLYIIRIDPTELISQNYDVW